MIFEQKNSTTEQGGIENAPVSMQFKATAQAFKALSSTVYNDKITACIREICCNAYDVHAMTGKVDVPFDVQLPTAIEPQFSVRDYGTGLSEADIINLYTTYFSSSKTETNVAVGGFGIGSKSPFSYTDTFTIISRHNGVKTSYIAIFEETGPMIVKADEEPTEEPSGLEIAFGVKISDILEFKTKFEKAMEFFPKPNCNISVNYVSQTYLVKTKDFGIKKGVSGYAYMKPRVIQGCVAYPITGLDFDTSVDLFLPVGSVEPSLSRESVSMTPTTIKILKDAYKSAINECFEASKLELNECLTLLDAVCLINIEFSRNTLLSKFDINKYYGKYQHIDFTEDAICFKSKNFKNVVITEQYHNKTTTYFQYNHVDVVGNPIPNQNIYFLSRYYADYVKFFIDDLPTSTRFIKRYLAVHNNKNYRIVMAKGPDAQRLFDRFGIKPLKTSELKELYPDTKRSYVRNVKEKFRIYDNGIVTDTNTRPSEFVYILTSYNKPKAREGWKVNDIIKFLKPLGISTDIYACRKEEKGGTELAVYVEEVMSKIDQEDIDIAFMTKNNMKNIGLYSSLAKRGEISIDTRRHLASICRSKDSPKSEAIRNFVMAYELFTGNQVKQNIMPKYDQADMIDQFYKNFPLIGIHSEWEIRRYLDEYVRYITMVEKISQLYTETNIIEMQEREVA